MLPVLEVFDYLFSRHERKPAFIKQATSPIFLENLKLSKFQVPEFSAKTLFSIYSAYLSGIFPFISLAKEYFGLRAAKIDKIFHLRNLT